MAKATDRSARPADSTQLGAPNQEAAHDDLAGLGYEQAREELIKVVQQLESGGAPLAESLELWERGERLAAHCQSWLDGAKAKVEAAVAAPRAGDSPADR